MLRPPLNGEPVRPGGFRAAMAGLVAVTSMVLASCSDDDDKRLTRAQLAARGDAVCNRLDADVKKLGSEFEPALVFPPEQMQELYTKMVPLVDRAIADFKSLDPPKDLEAKYKAATAQLGKDRKTLVAATESPEAAKEFFDRQVDPFRASTQMLAEVGITACSEDPPEGDAGEGAGSGPATTVAEATTSTTAP